MGIFTRSIDSPFHNDIIIRRIDDGQRNVGSARCERVQDRPLIFADDDRGFDGVRLFCHQLFETAALGQSSSDPHHGFVRKTVERCLGRMCIGRFGIIHETDAAPILRGGGGDGLNAVPTWRELFQRCDGFLFVCAKPQHQRQCGQRVGKQMRVHRAIRLSQMRELRHLGDLLRRSGLATCDAGHIDDPAVLHADLTILRLRQSESDLAAVFRRLGGERQLSHTLVISVVYQSLLDAVEDLRLIRRIIINAAMPVKMIIRDIGDRSAIQSQRIGEMQLEGTQLNA